MKNGWKLLGLMTTLLFAASTHAQCSIPWGGCSDPCAAPMTYPVAGVAGAAGCGNIVSGGVPVTTGSVLSDGSYACGPAISTMQASQPTLATPQAGMIVTNTATESLCGPITVYRTVMEAKYVTESRPVSATEYRDEIRYRTKTIYKTVPVKEQRFRTKLVNVPKTETKTVDYSVLVAKKMVKTVDVTESIPVWNEIPESYTVKVPVLVDVPVDYTVKVPKLRDETFTYTVQVPHARTVTRNRTVSNAVPVTKQRTINITVPGEPETKTVTKDYGHWEVRMEEVASSYPSSTIAGGCSNVGQAVAYPTNVYSTSGCSNTTYSQGCGRATSCGHTVSHGCSGCQTQQYAGCGNYSGCGPRGYSSIVSPAPVTVAAPQTTLVSRRVWVPNVQTETITVPTNRTESQTISYTVYEQQTQVVPYECSVIEYRPETRTGTKQVVDYVDEVRQRLRKQVEYREETRTRTRKQLTYQQVTRKESYPYVTYTTEKRTKEISYTYNIPQQTVEPYEVTRYDRVPEEQVEEYTVKVPYSVTKEQKVQVCRMVPRLVEEVINPCCDAASVSAPTVVSPSVFAPAGGSILSAPCGDCGQSGPCHCN